MEKNKSNAKPNQLQGAQENSACSDGRTSDWFNP
jgi:hypothetical protein